MAESNAQVVAMTTFMIECPRCGWEFADWVDFRSDAERIVADPCTMWTMTDTPDDTPPFLEDENDD